MLKGSIFADFLCLSVINIALCRAAVWQSAKQNECLCEIMAKEALLISAADSAVNRTGVQRKNEEWPMTETVNTSWCRSIQESHGVNRCKQVKRYGSRAKGPVRSLAFHRLPCHEPAVHESFFFLIRERIVFLVKVFAKVDCVTSCNNKHIF